MVNDANWGDLGSDDAYRYSTSAVAVHWPPAEHRKLLARWPYLAAAVGATWNEHRRQVERHCALVSRAGYAVNQVTGDVASLEAFLEGRRVTRPTEQDLFAYPDLRSQPTMVGWPPARSVRCWCGSERKYKQCCRPHGLGTLD